MDEQIKQFKILWPKIPEWAKEKIIKLAQTSTKREIWKDIVLHKGSGEFTKIIKGI